jgi:hypothetical protein
LGEEPASAERLRRYLNLNDSTQGAFAFPDLKLEKLQGEAKKLLVVELQRYAQTRSVRLGGKGMTLHASVRACGQEAMDFVLINHVGSKGVHVELDGAPGYPQTKHYPSLQRERVAVLGRAGYGIVHLRHADLYDQGWLRSGLALGELRTRLDAELDGHLLPRQS